MKPFNTGLFIDKIQKNPCLYNQADPQYKDPAKKFTLWQEIAQEFNFSSAEAAKAKWRNMRDFYVKRLKSAKNGTNSKRKYVSWPWSVKMEFLIPHVTGRQVLIENQEGDISAFVKQEEWEDMSGYQVEPVLQEETSQDRSVATAEHCTDYIDPVRVELSDSTDLMMLSYARRIRGFSRRRQVELGMKIAQLVMETELQEIAEQEASTANRQARNREAR